MSNFFLNMSYADKVVLWIVIFAVGGSLIGIAGHKIFGKRAANDRRRW